jgi:hypothetical protein
MKAYKIEKLEDVFETWTEFNTSLARLAAGAQPRFAFVLTSLTGPEIMWIDTADALVLAAALEHWAGVLRKHGAAAGQDAIGKPN